MEAPFPIIFPYVILNKALRVEEAWDDIREVDAVLAHMALLLRFSPFKPHGFLYVDSVCTIKYLSQIGLPGSSCLSRKPEAIHGRWGRVGRVVLHSSCGCFREIAAAYE
jgi:hypothetical protein